MENIIIYKSKKIKNSNAEFHLFTTIISTIVIILSCLIFSTLIFYKKKLSRIDLLVIVKNIFFTFIFSLFLFFSVQKQNYEVDKSYNYSTSVISCFYLSFLYGLQIAINIEQYKSVRNPCYVIKYMINNTYNISIHSFISFVISLFIAIIPYFFQNENNNIYDYIFTLTEKDYFDMSFSKNKLLSPFIIISFFLLLYFYYKIKQFYSNVKEKSLLHLKYMNFCLLINNIFYLVLAFILLVIPLLSKYVNISKIIQVMFYILSMSDVYLYIFKMFHSGFYYYYLNKTIIGFVINCLCFGCFFNNFSFPVNHNSSLITILSSKHSQSLYNFYSYLDYIVEDYILDTLDFILQVITAGLSIVYKDYQDKVYKFKSKIDFLSMEIALKNSLDDNNNYDNKENKDCNKKNLLINNDINTDSNENNEEDDLSNSSTYNFFKINSKNNNELENDLFSFNYCGDADIVITPLFVKESNESINLYKISKHDIINSLLSHKCLSLLMTNSKKIFFKKLNNLIIKTYDNRLLIELHTDIKIKNNSNFEELLSDYFNYLNYSNLNTFLCVLIGIFKIEINNLKEILIFVSKNPFIENVPSNFYNYWELMQFNIDKKNFNKLLSSKDRDSFIITNEDSLLTRNNTTFQLENFGFFQETINNDLKFLKSVSSSKFRLLLLYYEFEANRNYSKDSNFSKIRIKFINDSNSISDLFKNKIINISNSNFSLSINTSNNNISNNNTSNNNISNNNTSNNNISNNNTSNNNIINKNKNLLNNLYDDIDKEIFINPENKKKMDDNISDIPLISNEIRKIIIKNGFETYYNNYKGILYFRWDNIFYQNKSMAEEFYLDYFEEIIQFFKG